MEFIKKGDVVITEQKMFLDVLGSENVQYVIPVFQRVYSWNKDQCDELWGTSSAPDALPTRIS